MSEDTWDDARALGSRVWRRLKKAAGGAAESADKHLKANKLRGKLKKLVARERAVDRKIGEQVYQLHRKGKIRNSDILEECRQIDELREQMAEVEQKIRDLQQEAKEEPELEDEGFLTGDDTDDGGVEVELEEPVTEQEAVSEADVELQEPEPDKEAASGRQFDTTVDVTVTSSRDSDDDSDHADSESEDTGSGDQ